MIYTTSTKKHMILHVPGDKSISHRAIMLGALAYGVTEVEGFLSGQDCLSTISCFQELGVEIKRYPENKLQIHGLGIHDLHKPSRPLNVGNSGTTIRLMLGILAGAPFSSIVVGDGSISKRPMDRVILPLKEMGASIEGGMDGRYAPIHLQGEKLQGIVYKMPIASAQVKSCLLLAGLHAEGITRIEEIFPSRDHTERMLQCFGVEVHTDNRKIAITGGQKLTPSKIRIPGDISSAAFLFAVALLIPGLSVTVEKVGINPTRTGILDVFKMMGAEVHIEMIDEWENEPVGNITVSANGLQGVRVSGELIPRLIDEIPILAIVATQAAGETIISDASELRVKEANRISAMVQELTRLGADIEEREDGLRIIGPTSIRGGICDCHRDHRIAMALSIANIISRGHIEVREKEVIDVSFPGFSSQIQRVLSTL